MTTDLADLLQQVDPKVVGERVRAARELFALPLTDLSHATGLDPATLDDVEHGRRPADLTLLTAVAASTAASVELLITGLSQDALTDLQGDLDLARLSLSSSSPAGALTTAERILTQLDAAGATAPHLDRAARRLRARALEASGDLNGAIEELRRVSVVPVAEVEWVEDLISLSRCLRDSGDLAEAIAIGENAETEIRSLGLAETTEAIHLTVTVAAAYLFRGDVRHGARLCRRAADKADECELLVAKASALWNASGALDTNGDPNGALPLALEALAIYETEGDTNLLARLRTHVATLQLKTQPPDLDSALAMLERARVELDWAAGTSIDAARHRLCTARVLHSLGDDDRASDMLDESESLTPVEAPELRAWQSALRGLLAAERGDVHQTREHFLTAIHTLTSSGADKDAAQMWFELGDTLLRLGDRESALDAFRRAGISQGLQTGS
ncbi:helix-turn-helix domain-containing protein [Pimelobacter simplex]|uniref:helix-turn-helix domain-containing protein n=1 Tax=Nocardioides simplex TaxID=2045 RepID=UPI0021501529|nr:helix-turn-helix transcriptional regulator [Pimelobacter simplex]UUW89886.1 helix-turn-helix transcriptional regulator [Pimelobacter simplex]UUW93715.1 helix-turn-helix transcriptional regulator [Pimelobacter simplex]